jgi:uncharacterized membrane protein
MKQNMKSTKKTFNKRAIISITLLAALIMMPVSGVIIHISHGTETSRKWLHLHVVFGTIFMIAGVYHIIYNWRVLKNYLIGRK